MTKYFLKDGRSVRQYCREVKDRPPLGTIMYRLVNLNWTPDDAVTVTSNSYLNLVHGMSFKKYCETHGLNYIDTHIAWKRLTKRNKRFRKENITAEQFIDNLLNGVKYEWDLTEMFDNHYCRSKGLKYEGLYSYWSNFKRDQMSFREYVDYTLQKRNASTVYDMPLKTYCDQHGYSYHMLYSRYRRSMRKFKSFREYLIQWEKDNGYSSEAS